MISTPSERTKKNNAGYGRIAAAYAKEKAQQAVRAHEETMKKQGRRAIALPGQEATLRKLAEMPAKPKGNQKSKASQRVSEAKKRRKRLMKAFK